ncbi:MAG: hypothetical protein ABSF35_25200 [Polyangia bacterium]|jgi:hypothetical protein
MRNGFPVRFFMLLLGLGMMGCSSTANSTPDGPGGSDSAVSHGPDASRPLDTASGQADASSLGYTDGGCLSYAGASQLCGDGSPGTICAFSAQCGSSTSAGQCMINCTMGAGYSKCYGPSNVACLQNAMAAQNCTALNACDWIL